MTGLTRFAQARQKSATTSSMSSSPAGSPAGTSCAGAPSSASRLRYSAACSPPAARPALPRRRHRAPAGKSGATIKCGIITPAAAINPLTIADQGGLDMLGQTGEYLCLSDQHLTLQPRLATSWSSNTTADVWTFKIRQGVKFHNGAALTADDVVYTMKLQSNPQERVERAVGVGRGTDPRRGREGRRLHRRLPPRGPERELPLPGLVRQLQPDHPAEQFRPGQVGEHVHRHRPVHAEELHGRRSARHSPATRITGAPRPSPPPPSSRSTTPRPPRSSR